MKKTLTLLVVTIALVTSAFAQHGGYQQDRSKDYGYNKGNDRDKFANGYFFTSRERDIQISQINREYGYKIQSLQNRNFMGRRQRERQIFQLQQQRDDQVRSVWAKFNDRRNRANDKRGNGHW